MIRYTNIYFPFVRLKWKTSNIAWSEIYEFVIKGLQQKDEEVCAEEVEKQRYQMLDDRRGPYMVVSNNSDNEEEYTNTIAMNHIVNKRKLMSFTYFVQY